MKSGEITGDEENEPAPPSEREVKFDEFWSGLSEAEREKFEQDAVARADAFDRLFCITGKDRGGALFTVVQRRVVLRHFNPSLSKE